MCHSDVVGTAQHCYTSHHSFLSQDDDQHIVGTASAGVLGVQCVRLLRKPRWASLGAEDTGTVGCGPHP